MISIFPINISEILIKELVGKKYRYCIYRKDIMQPYTVFHKKNGSTYKQFNDNPTKFGTSRVLEKKIGEHAIFEESVIKKVWLYKGECFTCLETYSVMAELENGKTIELNIL